MFLSIVHLCAASGKLHAMKACLFSIGRIKGLKNHSRELLHSGLGLEDLDGLPGEVGVFTSKMTVGSSLLVPVVATPLQVKVDGLTQIQKTRSSSIHYPINHLLLLPSANCESGTTSAKGVLNGVGSGEFLQTGQLAFSFNHASTQLK